MKFMCSMYLINSNLPKSYAFAFFDDPSCLIMASLMFLTIENNNRWKGGHGTGVFVPDPTGYNLKTLVVSAFQSPKAVGH